MVDEESVVIGVDVETAELFHERWDKMGRVYSLKIHYCF